MLVQLNVQAFAINAGSCSAALGTIAVFGGTGLLGRECVYQALKANHKVVVLARDPSKMLIPTGAGGADADKPLVDDRLRIITGDVTNQDDVNKVFQSADDITGVIVALGGRTKDVGPTMLTDGTSCIIRAMKTFSPLTKRIAVVTSIGTGDSEKQAPWTFRALMYTVMRKTFADKNNQEQLFTLPTGPGHDLE
jgi:NAD(P)-dependent dehydrogenase (short-subunit alcohol dehydrogenase family)